MFTATDLADFLVDEFSRLRRRCFSCALCFVGFLDCSLLRHHRFSLRPVPMRACAATAALGFVQRAAPIAHPINARAAELIPDVEPVNVGWQTHQPGKSLAL